MGWCFYRYSNRLWAYGINVPENDTLEGEIGKTRRDAVGRITVGE